MKVACEPPPPKARKGHGAVASSVQEKELRRKDAMRQECMADAAVEYQGQQWPVHSVLLAIASDEWKNTLTSEIVEAKPRLAAKGCETIPEP